VFATAADPVGSGLVTSLARPGGNVTGLSVLAPELVGKCLEQLKQAIPAVSRVAVLWHPGAMGERTDKDMLKRAEVAAQALGVRLQVLEARGPADFDRAFSEMTRARADALTVLTSSMLFGERRRLVDLSAKNRLPAVYPWREGVDAGGLMAYGPDLADLLRRAATYVDKILKGAKPGDLPVEQPTKFDLVINLKTAKALGLTIPPSLLHRADQVIESSPFELQRRRHPPESSRTDRSRPRSRSAPPGHRPQRRRAPNQTTRSPAPEACRRTRPARG
jgi:putative ABC transport system substrate-binding protein